MQGYNERILRQLLGIYEKIMLTEDEALLKGNFSDLSRTEMHTLTMIGPYEKPTMGETAQKLNITTGTLTVAIDRLVRKKYVIRSRSEEDRRLVLLSLTRKGKVAYRIFWRFHTRLVDGMTENLTAEQKALFEDALSYIDRYITDEYNKYSEQEVINNDD